jgi:membrane protein implicated in regulation of membrane protease activity
MAGMLAYLFVPIHWVAISIAALCFLAGSLVSAMIFNRLATPEERRQDLEDRVRDQD